MEDFILKHNNFPFRRCEPSSHTAQTLLANEKSVKPDNSTVSIDCELISALNMYRISHFLLLASAIAFAFAIALATMNTATQQHSTTTTKNSVQNFFHIYR